MRISNREHTCGATNSVRFCARWCGPPRICCRAPAFSYALHCDCRARRTCLCICAYRYVSRTGGLSVLPTLMVYFGCCVATLRLRQRDVQSAGLLVRVPGGPTIPIAGIIFVCWLLSTATLTELLAVAGILILAHSLRALTRRYDDSTVAPNIAV